MEPPASLHPTDQTLSAFGLGKLDEESAESVNRHLEECDHCQHRVAGMSSDSFLGRLQKVHGSSAVPGGLPASAAVASQKVAASPADTLPPGLADHPDYKILRELGRGGMGVVYLAENTLMGRLEVLKVVGGHLVNRPAVRDRFLREIQSAAKLQHKNIVTAYSAIRLSDAIVLAMEYVEGEDLSQLVKSGGPLPVAHACNFVYQAALGLQHAHDEGLVHRDIKPHNLILAREGKKAIVKVLDFGLAKVTSEKPTDSGLTSEGQMLGTPDYIAPEQILDAQSADIRADIYSLGVTLYYLLTGHPPFKANSLYDLYQAHISRDADPLNLVRPEVPSELASLVAKMMAKEPKRRFQTPGEVAQALTRFFKPVTNTGTGSSPEISHVGQAPLAPIRDQSAVSQPASPRPAPAPRPAAPPKANPKKVAWESLIELKETERSEEAAKPHPRVASGPTRWPPWISRSVLLSAAGFAALLFGIIIYFRSDKDGTTLVVKTTGDPVPVAKSGPEPEDEAETQEAGFVPLFNGKNLDGWEFPVGEKSEWTVRGGTIRGKNNGGHLSIMATARTDYEDFHLRMEVRAPDRLGKWVLPRFIIKDNKFSNYSFHFGGERQLLGNYLYRDGATADAAIKKMGSKDGLRELTKPSITSYEMFTWKRVEIIAVGNVMRMRVEGSEVSAFEDPLSRLKSGQIGLRLPPNGQLEVRKIELKELNRAGDMRVKVPDTIAPTHETFDPNATYRFTNQCMPRQSLDVRKDEKNNNRLGMADVGDLPGQRWRITPLGDGWCRITNNGQPGKSLNLTNDDQTVMADINDTLRQQWKLTPLQGGWWRISNRRLPEKALDVEGNWDDYRHLKIAEVGNWTGQHWRIIRSEKVPAPASLPRPLPTGVPPGSITNSIGMPLVLIPAGSFSMGASDSDPGARPFEKPQHRVRITRPFYLGATEVTQGQYRAITGESPSKFTTSDDLPVERVSWDDAILFCKRLNEREGLVDAYRLPTEAEWEYACRAGSTTRYSYGDDPARLGDYAWYSENSGNTTHPVGRKLPNAWGLYDMHGNVREWCRDLTSHEYYAVSPVDDPAGLAYAPRRASRGGCWWGFDSAVGQRSTARFHDTWEQFGGFLGFRVARTVPPGPEKAKGTSDPTVDRKPFLIDEGRWTVDGNELIQDDAQASWPHLMFGDDRWTDYDFTVDVKRVSGSNNFGLIVRATEPDNYVVFTNAASNPKDSYIAIHDKGSPKVPVQGDYSVENHKWYTARVRVRGSEIIGTLHDSGKEVVKLKVNDVLHPRGRVGFRDFCSAYRFKNIKVTAPDGKILWEGPPAIDSLNHPVPAPAAGFTPLFNGNDLTGWSSGKWPADAWHVENGVLIGSGPKFSVLYSDRDDFRDFHLKAEVRVNDKGNSGILFRVPEGATWDKQYEATIGGDHGGLYVRSNYSPRRPLASIPAGRWFTLEVIAEGKHITTRVDGKTVVDHLDKGNPSPLGRVALELAGEPRTRVQFRKIEITELNGARGVGK